MTLPMFSTKLPLLALAICAALAGPAHASIIIGNLPGDDGSGRGFANTQAMGMGFTMLADYTFDDVILRFAVATVAPSPSQVDVAIYSNSGANKPGTMLVDTTGPASFLANTSANYTYTPVSPLTFTAGTTYWLVVHYTGSFAFQWKQSNPEVDPSGSGANYFGETFGNPYPNWDGGDYERGNFQLEGTGGSVPEPSLLMAPGLAVLAWVRSRRPRS
jgi:hypothetical protein